MVLLPLFILCGCEEKIEPYPFPSNSKVKAPRVHVYDNSLEAVVGGNGGSGIISVDCDIRNIDEHIQTNSSDLKDNLLIPRLVCFSHPLCRESIKTSNGDFFYPEIEIISRAMYISINKENIDNNHLFMDSYRCFSFEEASRNLGYEGFANDPAITYTYDWAKFKVYFEENSTMLTIEYEFLPNNQSCYRIFSIALTCDTDLPDSCTGLISIFQANGK